MSVRVGTLSKSRRSLSLPSLLYWFRLSLRDLTTTAPSLANQPDPVNSGNTLSERSVLEQVSDFLSIEVDTRSLAPTADVPSKPKVAKIDALAGLLSPEERLRGVFLQKLYGRSAVEAALRATNVDLTVEILAGVLNKGNLGGEAMISFFNWAIKEPSIPHDLETYRVVLKALGRRKFFPQMEEILFQMNKDGINLDSTIVLVITDSYARAHRVTKAIEFFEKLDDLGGEKNCDSFTAVISSLCRRSHVKSAESLFRRSKGKISIGKTAYDEIIGGWAKLGRVKDMKNIWTEMISDGLIPDNCTYSHLIEGLGRSRRIEDAVSLFNRMEGNGCLPDAMTYKAMIRNFRSTRNLSQCEHYFRQMVAKKLFPDMETYQILIRAFIRVRRIADALELFDEMLARGVHPSTSMITYLIELLCRNGPPHAAMLIYKKSRKRGCLISLKAFKILLMRLANYGKSGTVLQVWDEMQEAGYSSDSEVYEFIVNGLCNTGQLETAVLVVEESVRNCCCIGKIIYSKLNNRLLEMNKVEMAYRLFLKVKEARTSLNAQRYWRSRGWHF